MANEKRLIDANKALERADEVTFMGFRAEERKQHFMDLVSEILKQSTVDAVEVVRCKNCKQYNGHRYCCYFAQTVLDNDFCSYGERKDNG